MRTFALLALFTVLISPSTARADSFGEVAAGVAVPMSDDDYENAVDTSFRLALRAGALNQGEGKLRLGFELSADWTPLSSDLETGFTDESFHRIMGLAGVRVVYDLGGQSVLTARLAGGVSFIRAALSGEVFGVEFESIETDVGIAIDPSVAAQARFGDTGVGIALGFPVAIHDHDGEEFDIDFTSFDLNIMFVITGGL